MTDHPRTESRAEGRSSTAEDARALSDIREHLTRTIGATRDPELTSDILDAVMTAMPEILDHVRTVERAKITSYLDRLSEGRMEYVHTKVEHAGDIEAMGGLQAVVYGEATGAKWLARILRGETDDRGWLPSWRWAR